MVLIGREKELTIVGVMCRILVIEWLWVILLYALFAAMSWAKCIHEYTSGLPGLQSATL